MVTYTAIVFTLLSLWFLYCLNNKYKLSFVTLQKIIHNHEYAGKQAIQDYIDAWQNGIWHVNFKLTCLNNVNIIYGIGKKDTC